MNLTDNAYNGYKCMKGFTEKMRPYFNDDPKIDNAKYVKWFGCIAEIPETEK